MKFLIFGIAFIAYFGFSNAAGCKHPVTKHEWAVGTDHNPIGQCVTYNCRADDDFTALNCGLVQAPANKDCKQINEDLTKPYPDCCGRFDCP